MINIKSGVNFEIAFAWKKEDGDADTGLSPILYMYKLSDSSLVRDGVSMTEVAKGGYKYDIATTYLVSGETYMIQADGTASADDATTRYQYMFIAVDYNHTIAQIAAGIWNALIATYNTVTGSFGKLLSDNVDQKTSRTGMGTGTISLPIDYRKTGTTSKWAGVQCWLTTDTGGNTLYGSKQNRTNHEGVKEFWVAAGTYYFWTNQESTYVSKHVVAADETIDTTD